MNKEQLIELGNKRVKDLTEEDIQVLMFEGLSKIKALSNDNNKSSVDNIIGDRINEILSTINETDVHNDEYLELLMQDIAKEIPHKVLEDNSSVDDNNESSVNKILGDGIIPQFNGILSDLYDCEGPAMKADKCENLLNRLEGVFNELKKHSSSPELDNTIERHINSLKNRLKEQKSREEILNTYLRNLSGWNQISTGCLNELEKVGIFTVKDAIDKFSLLLPCVEMREHGMIKEDKPFIDFIVKMENDGFGHLLRMIPTDDDSYNAIKALSNINKSHKIEIDSIVRYIVKEIFGR